MDKLEQIITIVIAMLMPCITFAVWLIKLGSRTDNNAERLLAMEREHKNLNETVDEINDKLARYFAKQKIIEHDIKNIRGVQEKFYELLERDSKEIAEGKERQIRMDAKLDMLIMEIKKHND